jgi:carboxymethylenebutenolidase
VHELPQTSVLSNIWKTPGVAAVVAFTGQEPSLSTNHIPLLSHSTSKSIVPGAGHSYDGVKSTNFILPSHEHFQAAPAGVAHTRSLGFLKKHLGGPNFDLEAIWDEHTLFEFGERNVEKTMSTMVAEPYVNHVPTVPFLPLPSIRDPTLIMMYR